MDLPGWRRTLQGGRALPDSTLIWGVSGACLAGGLVLSFTRSLPAALATILSLLSVLLAFHRPALLLLGLFVWLPFLGFVRRLPPLSVPAEAINPLLIVGPVVTGVLLLLSRKAGWGRMTRLAWAVLALSVLIFLSAFNPLQGGLKVGLAGLVFMLIPVLWFWIGRALGQPRLLQRLLRMIAGLAVLTALYGLWQTVVGFPSWDRMWINEKGYAALNVRDTIRPFSTFSSASEYATFIGIGLAVFWSAKKRTYRLSTLVAVTAVILTALFLIATRSNMLLTIFALALLLLAKRGFSLLKAVSLLVMAIVLFSASLRLLMLVPFENDRIASLVEHQVGGLANPFDPQKSTLGIHTGMVVSGVKEAFRHPLGHGAGAVNLASSKLGGRGMDTEVDFSNAAVALGLPGLLLFSYIAVAGSLLAYRTAQTERSFLAVAAVGILAVTGLHWLIGGQYSVAPLPWLFLGWLDRRASSQPFPFTEESAEIPAPDPATAEPIVATPDGDLGPAAEDFEEPGLDRDAGEGARLDDNEGRDPLGPELQPLHVGAGAHAVLSRLIDVTLASVGLILLAPLLAVLALLIRFSTGSSGLFAQVRLGKDGRPFRLLKLRTLSPEAPPQVPKRQAQDMATRLGTWLRASKLDEAPQLWNVVKGEMALVGPRPIIPEEYTERSHYQRLKARPGLTGFWQLSKARGHPFDENPEYDLFYLENRSLGFDLWILWRTALLLLFGRETGMELAATLWERRASWRAAVPRAAEGVPGRSPTWRPAITVFLISCIAMPVTLWIRAGISVGTSGRDALSSLAAVLVGEGPRLLAWTLGIYIAAACAFLLLPVLASGRRSLVRRAVWAAGLLLGVTLVLAVPPVMAARSHLEQSREALLQATQQQENIDLRSLESDLDSARLLALTARDELESPLTFGARLVPIVRGNIEAAHALASAVASIIPAVNQSVAIAGSLGSEAPDQAPIFHKGRLDLARVQQISTPLAAAAATARSAVEQAEKGEGLLVPPLSRAVRDFVSTGGRLATALQGGAEASRLLPAFLGSEAPRTYFLMIQNGAEQRATGGYLGAFAILHANKGQLSLEGLQPNNALPPGEIAPPPSPEFAERYDRFESRSAWHNVNMTPDFPTASRMIAELWQGRTGQPIDGVLAVDAVGLAELMKVSGPVSVPEFPDQITSENFVRLALNEAYVRFPDKSARVDFLLPIASHVWSRLIAGEGLETRTLVQAFGRSFSTKHMQFWTRQEDKTLERLGIDGGLKPAKDRDYLFVVGQNAAGNKVDFYAKRSIRYDVQIAPDGKTSAKASVVLKNSAPASGLPNYILGPFGNLPDPPGLNRSYLSLYVPRNVGSSNARLDGIPVGLESHSERNLAVVSKYIEVPSGQTSRLQVDLGSRSGRKGEYRLVVQHQPALRPDMFALSIKLPDGAVVTKMSPGMRLEGGRVQWRGPLTRDREFYIRFSSSVAERFRSLLQRPMLLLL